MSSFKKVQLIGIEGLKEGNLNKEKQISEKDEEIKQFIANDKKLENIKEKLNVIKNENFKLVNKDEINEKLLKIIEDIVFKVLQKQNNHKVINLNKHSITKLNIKPKTFIKKRKNNWVYL
jgi:hypothetical protein